TDHEQEVLENVTRLRQEFMNQSDNEKVKKSNEARELVNGLNVQVEAYPDLKANENYLHLQKTVNELEAQISATRRTYNARVNQYNNWTQQIPMVFAARLMGFPKRELLHIDEQKKEDVD